MHLFKTAVAAVLCLSLTAITAEASYPPLKYTRTRADLAQACTALGAHGQSYGLDQPAGPYGCRDMESGNAVTCKGDGSCTDYSGDPRWRKIHDWLNGKVHQTIGQSKSSELKLARYIRLANLHAANIRSSAHFYFALRFECVEAGKYPSVTEFSRLAQLPMMTENFSNHPARLAPRDTDVIKDFVIVTIGSG